MNSTHPRWLILVPLVTVFIGVAGCGGSSPPTVLHMSAAASTREAVEATVTRFTSAAPKIAVEMNFGSSSTLSRQIEQSGLGDLFLSADVAWVDALKKSDLVADSAILLTNRLVVVVPADSSLKLMSLRDLTGPGIRRCAVGAEQVPAGTYAREAFSKSGLLDALSARLISAPDVRAALTYVIRGEAEAGVVYRSDAVGDARVRTEFEIDASLHRPILYSLALIRHEPEKPAARVLYDHLRSESGVAPFVERGFGVPSPGEAR